MGPADNGNPGGLQIGRIASRCTGIGCMSRIEWKPGDRVLHQSRPEWGVGAVTQVQKAVQDGMPCQRLTVRFENAGLRTVSTAFANLKPADNGTPQNSPFAESDGHESVIEQLRTLPDDATDPFRPFAKRIRATIDLYRYTSRGASILAWATAMTGLSDPLSRVSRHELEEEFRRFEVLRDRHLAQLVQAAAKEGIDPAALKRAMPPEAQRALQRLNH